MFYAAQSKNDAIDKFEPGRGFKFETYAISRIKGAILDELLTETPPGPQRADVLYALARTRQADLPTIVAVKEETGDVRRVTAGDGDVGAGDYGQGYLFSRPLPAEHFEVFLERIEGRLALDLLAPSGLALP